MYLEKINSPSDIKKLSVDEMKKLTQEMRDALIFKLSVTGATAVPISVLRRQRSLCTMYSIHRQTK